MEEHYPGNIMLVCHRLSHLSMCLLISVVYLGRGTLKIEPQGVLVGEEPDDSGDVTALRALTCVPSVFSNVLLS